MRSTPQRYQCVDAWRGLAALAVVIFHCSNTIVDQGSAFGRVLLSGWLGVFVFFPISGYCILAALQSPENRTIRTFLARRWWRIMPPYWASILLTVGLGLAALLFNRGSAGDFALSPFEWLSIATLTQVFTSPSHSINPVYWSLCYEEQFYLVMASRLVVPARRRAPLLTALTIAAALYALPVWSLRVQGLFLEFWMCFATGCAAYLWLHDRGARRWAVAIFVVAGLMGMATVNLALLVSFFTAIALASLARCDAPMAAVTPVSALMQVGAFSFSLYLIHVPIGGRVTNLLDRFGLPTALIVSISVAFSVGAAWLFYLAVEKRSLMRRPVAVEYARSGDATRRSAANLATQRI